ncbi:hypothetical protein EOS_27890 [Caballeronia mineralivorans PML1(12)]|uniref:Uncharacterized protein n=1 Tax=Caballeronia mineralivorans PML1(12) TaxID=908627 RepID=A0A0J1CQN0_9BURK|nr:hypothetical protein EOS_27890 [Caballeronia mineralivorans PML1(12)]
MAQNGQQLPQDKQIAAPSETQQAIRATASAASGGNAAQASALTAKATAELPKDGSYLPSSVNTLYRNAEGLLRSGNTAEHAVGYAIASKLAEATGFGDAQGPGRRLQRRDAFLSRLVLA